MSRAVLRSKSKGLSAARRVSEGSGGDALHGRPDLCSLGFGR
jgi:hypothetical protein